MGKVHYTSLLWHSQQSVTVTWLPKPACCAELTLPCCRGHSRVWRMPSQSAMLADRSPRGASESPGLAPTLLPQPSSMSFSALQSPYAGGSNVSQRLSQMPFVSATALLSGGSVFIGEASPGGLCIVSTCMVTSWSQCRLAPCWVSQGTSSLCVSHANATSTAARLICV